MPGGFNGAFLGSGGEIAGSMSPLAAHIVGRRGGPLLSIRGRISAMLTANGHSHITAYDRSTSASDPSGAQTPLIVCADMTSLALPA